MYKRKKENIYILLIGIFLCSTLLSGEKNESSEFAKKNKIRSEIIAEIINNDASSPELVGCVVPNLSSYFLNVK